MDSYRQTVDAWKTYAEGDSEKALVKMAKSADLEDSVDKHPVTPGAVLPARELLADMLLLEKKDLGEPASEPLRCSQGRQAWGFRRYGQNVLRQAGGSGGRLRDRQGRGESGQGFPGKKVSNEEIVKVGKVYYMT